MVAAPVMIFATTAALLALNLSGPPGSPGSLNGYGWADVYAYHAVLECGAFALLFPSALLAYVADGKLVARLLPDTRARHVLHGGANLLGTMCAVSGFMIAFTYHQVLGKDHTALTGEVGDHNTWTRPAHVITGYAVLLGVFIQCTAGLCKFASRAPEHSWLRTAHARAGPLLWIGGLTCIALAAYFEYLEKPPQDKPHWTGGQLAAILVLLALLATTVLSLLACAPRVYKAAPELEPEADERAFGLLQ